MTTTQPQPIPMWLPHIGPETIGAATGALEIGYLGLGSATKEFEDALADYLELGADRALMSTNSCTAALNCACLLAGAGPGTEVIAPSFTYVAAHQAITATGPNFTTSTGYWNPDGGSHVVQGWFSWTTSQGETGRGPLQTTTITNCPPQAPPVTIVQQTTTSSQQNANRGTGPSNSRAQAAPAPGATCSRFAICTSPTAIASRRSRFAPPGDGGCIMRRSTVYCSASSRPVSRRCITTPA